MVSVGWCWEPGCVHHDNHGWPVLCRGIVHSPGSSKADIRLTLRAIKCI